ncbi:MAG: DUF5615 family PIN-like protein [Burkholderiaceae bacterium]
MTRAVLLDENIPLAVADGLRAAGHDVRTIADSAPGVNDRGVMQLARDGGRALLTFDSDFGDLVFQHGEPPPVAVLYFRLHPVVDTEVLALALEALSKPIEGSFVVVTRQGLRSRPFDSSPVDD